MAYYCKISMPQPLEHPCLINQKSYIFTADLFTIIPSLLVLSTPAFLLFFTSTIHLFNAPLVLLLTASLLTLLLPPHLPFTSLLLQVAGDKELSTFLNKKPDFKKKNKLPPPAFSSVPSVAQCVSAFQPVVGACTPPAPGAAAPGAAAGDGGPLIVPCSPAAGG